MVAKARASGAVLNATFVVDTSAESERGAAVVPATAAAIRGLAFVAAPGVGLVAATGAGGAVVDEPAMMGADAVGLAAGTVFAVSTSPALDFDSTRGALLAAVRRALVAPLATERRAGAPPLGDPRGMPRRAVVAGGATSDDRSTHPVRDTRTQPEGADPLASDTVVPASRDATVRAAEAPPARSTAARFPTRRVVVPR
jgi:hypothetical protein